MLTPSNRTPAPWVARRENWRGEPVAHKIYISGDVHEDYGDEDDEPDEDRVPTIVGTAVAIVEGHATSGNNAAANAALMTAAWDFEEAAAHLVARLIALEDDVPPDVAAWAKGVIAHSDRRGIDVLRAAIAKSTQEIERTDDDG